MMKNKMELLAPAGGMHQLKAAVQSGADAVYLGAASFSARAGAGNFNYAELKEAVDYCHVYGVKVHCAINTLIKESELNDAIETAISVSRCGIDALIIQDIGFAAHIRKILPDMELHASTQMTVTSLEGVKYLEEHGFSRVVLARELSVDEITEIVRGAKAEIEVFVHGAICMSYSGQCLMSSILGGRSGNRGRCAQPCRLPYELLENGSVCDSAYILSPKDMALINRLDELRNAGVTSLKIEGRLKSAEYVSAVVGVYRKYLDDTKRVSREDMDELIKAFSRSGFTDGYFTGKTGADMMSHSNPANNSGSSYSAAAKDRAAGKTVRRIPVNMFAELCNESVLKLTVYDNDGNCVSCEGTVKAEPAVNKALDSERLCKQLSKLGESCFCVEDINAHIDENITIPVSEINRVRRNACDMLFKERAKTVKQRENITQPEFPEGKQVKEQYLCAEVRTFEQGMAAINSGDIKRIYAPAEVAKKLAEKSSETEIVTKTSDIFIKEKINTEYVSVSSPAAMRYYGEKAKYGDYRLNIYNSLTALEFGSLKCVTLSPELNMREISELTEHLTGIETEIIGYGRIPLMLMKNCPVKAMGRCQKGKDIYSLRDRKNIEFPIMCTQDCKAVLLNSKPLFLADIISQIKNVNAIRLNFTVEDLTECEKIIKTYSTALKGGATEKPLHNTYTRGHLKRGVL